MIRSTVMIPHAIRTIGFSAIAIVCALTAIRLDSIAAQQAPERARAAADDAGSTTTRLADGRWLIAGGDGHESRAWIWDPATQSTTSIGLQVPRAWHTATVLADGSVLIAGGRRGNTLAEVPELFDPASNSFTPMGMTGAMSRTGHSATLLTDGRVLVAGGTHGGAAVLQTEIWDVAAMTATPVEGPGLGRVGHAATLSADGRVAVSGGTDLDGGAAQGSVVIDPIVGAIAPINRQPETELPTVAETIPAPGAQDVPVSAHFAIRFSAAMNIESVNAGTLSLAGADGPVAARIVVTEDGRLVFVWPVDRLRENSTYTLTIGGAVDRRGVPVLPAAIPFTTAGRPDNGTGSDGEDWVPDGNDGWRTNRPASPWQKLKPLEAPPGVTALSGQVLRLNGEPLADVRLEVDKHVAHTDRTGRFLVRLDGMANGHVELWIDGRAASRPSTTYGTYEVGVDVDGSRTNVLPYTIWMTKIDTAHAVTLTSPTVGGVVVTTPLIPGLQLQLPPQTVIRDHDGKTVTSVSITPVPLDRPPFPLPADVNVPVYFTIQPGGAYVYVNGSTTRRGARLIYPNGFHRPPGMAFDFWHYSPDGPGWTVYGRGAVTSDGQQVVPNPGVELYEFTGAMAAPPGFAPSSGPPPGGKKGGDPVDLFTGLFVLQKTDLVANDVVPVALTRTYRPADTRSRAFGIGSTHPYDIFLVGNTSPYTYLDLILADGGRVHFDRTSPGTDYQTAVYQHTATPTAWFHAGIVWNGAGWTLAKKDGTILIFPDGFLATTPQQAALKSITDRFGNVVTLTRDANANLTQIRTPNGRTLTLAYDGSARITQAQDSAGRTVGYTYDGSGRLWKVTDPENGVTEYTYDSTHRVSTIKDARGIVYLMNQYDASDRVTRQVLADGGAYQFSYSVDGQGQKVTDVTNPRGYVTRTTFNAAGYAISQVEAVSTAIERTTATTREAGTNFPLSVVDGLSRHTDYTYDGHGHVQSITRLAGTGDAVTTNYTYEPLYFQMATITDPLTHTWTWTYDGQGRLTGMTDPLTHHTTIGLNTAGQVTSVTDPLSHQWQFTYSEGDLTATTNPLNQTTTQFVDGLGRVTAIIDPLNRTTRTTFDKLNRVTQLIDALGGQTALNYDANGNLLSLTDALTHVTSYTYDLNDRVVSRRDPLQQSAVSGYDANGNLAQMTDRKGQITRYTYDGLDRLSQVTYADGSTIVCTYDAGDRVTQLVDSANGAITRVYDGLDRLTSEATLQGSISYTYDTASRRASMTIAGQPQVTYGYDNANRLTSITQGASVVGFSYDDANRRGTVTYPNGIVGTYGYDNANQLTSLTYALGANTLGNLTYTYDAAGQRTGVSGSWARTGLPAAVASASYDAANRILTWNGIAFSADANGNLTSDGAIDYTWNARNQLSGLSAAAAAAFSYDSVGRRRSKTTGMTTSFVYDKWNTMQELVNGTPSVNVIGGSLLDEVLVRSDVNGAMSLLPDAQRSVLASADTSGALKTTYTYDSFGRVQTSGDATENDIRYTSRPDDGTGLYYLRARYYSPGLQRFISEDPKGFAGADANVFAYVANSPISFVDPLGLDRTIWDTGGNGRLGPRNGNWGGGDWSGGLVPGRNGGHDGNLPPLDSADRCYMEHDRCYEKCVDHRLCDRELLRCLHQLPWNPRNWPEPPRPGTVFDTLWFMWRAELIFGESAFGYMVPW